MPPSPPVVEGFPEYPPRSELPNLTLPASLHRDDINPCQITESWISALRKSSREKNTADLSNLFVEESWWRDLLGLGWEITSKYGPAAISSYVLGSTTAVEVTNIITTPPLHPQIKTTGPATYIQAGFTFTTKFGHGRGLVRLACVTPNEWKAWTVSTELERLTENINGDTIVNGNTETKSEDEFQVLVIGAGKTISNFPTPTINIDSRRTMRSRIRSSSSAHEPSILTHRTTPPGRRLMAQQIRYAQDAYAKFHGPFPILTISQHLSQEYAQRPSRRLDRELHQIHEPQHRHQRHSQKHPPQ